MTDNSTNNTNPYLRSLETITNPPISLETRHTEKNMLYLGRKNGLAIVSKVNYSQTKNSPQIPNNSEMTVDDGLVFILYHFQQPIWPRTISTIATEGRQIVVNNERETLARFKAANWLDCRISAYPLNADENPSAIARFQGIEAATPANILVMTDLDRCNFKTDRALGLALCKTLQTIKKKLGPKTAPTVIWSGRGYHIIQVIDAHGVNLEREEIFTKLTNQPSRRFLQFAEGYLSSGKSDKSHNSTVSFRNCMLRVPGSINSKNGQIVQIKMKWNGYKPAINYLLSDFCVSLVNQNAQELREQPRRQQQRVYLIQSDNGFSLHWIERLLQTPIADGRKYCIWRIMVPYLINRRHVSHEQCIHMIKKWLDQCSKLEHLSFNLNQKINDAIRHVATYGPAYPDKLKQEYPELYKFLVESRVFG